MYRTFLFFVFFSFFVSVFTHVPEEAAAAEEYYINPVTLNVNSVGQETFSFVLGKAAKYNAFRLTGANPRMVIDFPDAVYRGKKNRKLNGHNFALAIRSAFHKNPERKTRIVIDLQPGEKIEHSLSFDKAQKTLTLVLSGDKKKAVAKEAGKLSGTDTKNVQGQSSPAGKEEGNGSQKPKIRSISFDAPKPGEERVRFRLNGFYPPRVSTSEDGTPKVICDFVGAGLAKNIEAETITDGNLVKRITAAKSADNSSMQVILELTEGKDFDLQQIFFRDGNLFVLVVREFADEDVAKKK